MARSYNGTSDEINTASGPGTLTAYTWCAWLNGTATPGTTTVTTVFHFDSSSDTLGFSWDHSASTFKQAAYQRDSGGGYHPVQINGTLNANTWYHVAASWDGSTLAVYLNGVSQNTLSLASIQAVTGFSTFANSGSGQFWSGRMAEVAFWSRALSANEISALAAGCSPTRLNRNSLTFYFPLWGLHSPEPDMSGSGNTGTLTGTSQFNHAPVTTFTRKAPAQGAIQGAAFRDVGLLLDSCGA